MSSSRKYSARLRRLYDRRKIGVSDFACPHLKSCRAAAKAHGRYLSLGAEAHVGDQYGIPMRLVVVSLDTGGRGERTWRGEDLDTRKGVVQGVTSSEANPHMKGTLQILKKLYGVERDSEERESEVLRRFAMINSAKCAGRDDDASTVPDEVHDNCREHGLAELSVLDPQLIVTQGARARGLFEEEEEELHELSEEDIREHVPTMMWGNADVGLWIGTQVREHLKYWDSAEQRVLVLQVPHPAARQGQWQRFERTMLPTIAHVVRQWLSVPDQQ